VGRESESVRNRLIGIAVGMVIAAAVLYIRFGHPPPAPYLLLDEDAGLIRTVAIQYTCDSAPMTQPALESFFRQAAPDVEVIAACGSSADAADFDAWVSRSSFAHPDRFHTVVVGVPITGWCKDRFLVTSAQPVQLIEPVAETTTFVGRVSDSLVAPAIQKAYTGRFQAVGISMHFDSGDILPTAQSVIVSDELSSKNGNRPAVAEELNRLFGRRVIWLTGVPPHHIGMFVAPLGDNTVLVGDPAMARLANTSATIGSDEIKHADFSPRVQAMFDHAAKELGGAGFRVVRIPEVYLAPKVYISYTNAVFETAGAKKFVYMPWYDIPHLDEAAKRIYESQGWTVRPVPVRTLYRQRGTIGCLINVLGRR